MDNVRKFQNGINIEPTTSLIATDKGDIEVDSSTGKLNYHNGTTESPLVTESHSATLTNKTIDADNNTISNIDNNEIKALAGIDATKIANGSVSNTEFQYLDGVTSAIQTQVDSKITGPGLATDEALVRFDGTTGKLAQNSVITATDAGILAGITQLNVDNLRLDGNTLSSTDTDGSVTIDPNGNGNVSLVAAGSGVVQLGSSSFNADSAGSVNITGDLDVDNLNLNGNTISSTDSNGNVTIDPNGTGDIQLTVSGAGATVDIGSTSIQADGSGTLTITGQLNADNLRLDGNTLSSTNTDGNILLDPNGTGFTSVESGPLRTAEQSAPGTPASGYNYLYPKTDGYLYYKNDAGAETKIQSGSGGINYISNPDFEGDTTGWATYADAAGTAPVDGTGGSANITFTRTTSSPLRGTGSGLITKDAANRQGQGVSYDFTIDSADKSKQLSIQFDYEASANYTGSSGTEYMVCYVYDVTNSVQIPASSVSSSVPQGSGSQKITFDATTSTSYRLEFHIAGTGTSDWTYKIDNVQVGPQEVTLSAPVSDWQSWTPTGSWVSNATYTGMKARVGDRGIYRVHIALAGAPTNTALTINMPTGEVIDTTKFPSAPVADMTRLSTAVNIVDVSDTPDTPYLGTVAYSSTTAVGVRNFRTFNANVFVTSQVDMSATAPITFASGDYIDVEWSVPIVSWSSNIQLANSRVEYASNSSVADSDDTTSFVNDPNGSPVQNATLTGGRFRRIRFKNPIQASDSIILQVKPNNAFDNWINADAGYRDAGSNTVIVNQVLNDNGLSINKSISATDLDIYFGRYYTGSSNWSTSNTSRWRVVKYSNAVPVETAANTYTEVVLSADTSTVTADTYADVTGASLTLDPGVWDIGFQYNIVMTRVATTSPAGNVAITDSSNTLQGSALSYHQTVLAADGNTLSIPGYIVARNISVTTSTTYKVRIRCQAASTAAKLTIAGSASQTGSLTDPDSKCVFWARRIS